MNGLIRDASRDHFDYVVSRWAALPDGTGGKHGKSYPVSADGWIEVTEAMALRLRDELTRTGTDYATLLNGLANVPRGLNVRIIKGWVYREAASTRATHWAFVTTLLEGLPSV